MILLELGRRLHTALLRELPRHSLDELIHCEQLPVLRSHEGGVECDVSDVIARDGKLFGEKLKVNILVQRHLSPSPAPVRAPTTPIHLQHIPNVSEQARRTLLP